jgi:hypothetical protein
MLYQLIVWIIWLDIETNNNHVCDQKPKNTIDSSTNTLVITKREISTQVDQLDIYFEQIKYAKLEYEIFNRLYFELESQIVSDLLDQYLGMNLIDLKK